MKNHFFYFSPSSLAVAALAMLGFAGPAQAATTNWSASFGGCSNGTVYAAANSWGEIECAVETGGVDVDVRGVATSADGNTTYAGKVYSWGGSGLGVVNTDSTGSEDPNAAGPHAADNLGRIDGIVLQFSQSVDLESLSIGWNGTDDTTTTSGYTYNDSDLAVYAWNGGSTGPTDFNRTAAGWLLVGTPENVGASNNTPTTKVFGGTANIYTTQSSSYWLISALGNNADCNIDAFKLLSVAGLTGSSGGGGGSVPEPGSLALLGLGAAGLLAARRKAVARR